MSKTDLISMLETHFTKKEREMIVTKRYSTQKEREIILTKWFSTCKIAFRHTKFRFMTIEKAFCHIL